MGRIPPLVLLCALCLCPFPAAQDAAPVTVGVAAITGAMKDVPAIEAWNRLVKALNQQKADKKQHFQVTAVRLDAVQDTSALDEAKAKRCQFLLSTRVTDIQNSPVLTYSGAAVGLEYVPVFHATMEYRLTRTADGAGFSIGSGEGEDPASPREAAWRAITHLAEKAMADLATAGHGTRLGNSAAATIFPRQIELSAIDPNYCAWFPAIPHVEALHRVCEYSVSLRKTMPNFICDQSASRYRGKSDVPVDLITSSVRYEDGTESYSAINQNGAPMQTAIGQAAGLWSTGQFGGNNLRSVFSPHNQASFTYSREINQDGHPVWIFTYQIAKQNDPLWRLHAANQAIAPPYKGELWVDQKTGHALRFQSVAQDLPPDFPMTAAELQIDYEDVSFGDGSSFTLPTYSVVTIGNLDKAPTRNVIQFRNCHKFRAQARVLSSAAHNSSDPSSEFSADTTLLEALLEESKQIYEILCEQVIREQEARLELDQRQELTAATTAALSKLVALEKQRHDNLAHRQSLGGIIPPSAAKRPDGVTTLKVRVNLVEVRIVLRDSKGRAVGGRRKEDFQLFDDRKPQQITSFSVEQSAAAKPEPARPNQGPASSSVENQAVAPPATERDVAYVFDDVHGSPGELANLRDAAKRHLAGLRAADRAAIITTSGEVQVDFTKDREKLSLALENLQAHPTTLATNCPPVSFYMSHLMVNTGDSDVMGLALGDTVFCAFGGFGTGPEREQARRLATAKAFEMLNTGNRESRQTLGVLADVILRTAAMPGHRSIILASPGFLTLEPDLRQSVMELIDRAIASDIVINTLDVRGLYSPGMDASRGHSTDPTLRLQLDTTEAATQSDVMFEMANGTGGTFFQHNNDLDEGFRRTAAVPEYVYVLGFSPQKLDGKFHKLKVTLAGAGKLTVQARQGYYAAKPAN
jgi:VWFA-related protein